MTICVPNRDKAELREVKITPSSDIEGELICYFEPILTKQEEYRSHPAFSKLFLETESDHNGVLVKRGRERRRYVVLVLSLPDDGASFSLRRTPRKGRLPGDTRLTAKPLLLTEARLLTRVITKIPVRIGRASSE